MRKSFFLVFWVLAIFFGLFSINSCKTGSSYECNCEELICEECDEVITKINDDFESTYLLDANGFQKLLAQYHAATNPSSSAQHVSEKVDVFFDMSTGMKSKIRAEGGNDGLVSYLLNVVPNNSNYFVLNSRGYEPLKVSDPKVHIRVNENYTANNNYAQLDSTIAAISRHNDRQSILVTDGELAIQDKTNNYLDIAWAKEHFTKWLGGENRIDFVVTPIGEERLFFILFTPWKLSGKNETQSIVSKFLNSTDNAGKSDRYELLTFTINDYYLEKQSDKRPIQEDGINSTMIDWMGVEMYSRFVELPSAYEHIHFEDQEAFLQYVDDFTNEEYKEDFVKTLNERNKLFYNLRITNEFIQYQIANLGLEVKDFTDDFKGFADHLKCQQSSTVEYEDEEGDTQTFWCNPWFDCEDKSACNFNSNRRGRNVPELFELHEESTIQKNQKSFNIAEIAIKPAENFDFDNWWNSGLLRIDLYIKDVDYSPKQNFNLLKWNHKNGQNIGLSESIRLAMSELKPSNKLFFSYYLTFPIEL
ncbi:MAG: hypothetical protein GY705_24285 [Bacteroidetes bacterium]|nr:hypothetical protein [Bacteroidota bacterium]